MVCRCSIHIIIGRHLWIAINVVCGCPSRVLGNGELQFGYVFDAHAPLDYEILEGSSNNLFGDNSNEVLEKQNSTWVKKKQHYIKVVSDMVETNK